MKSYITTLCSTEAETGQKLLLGLEFTSSPDLLRLYKKLMESYIANTVQKHALRSAFPVLSTY